MQLHTANTPLGKQVETVIDRVIRSRMSGYGYKGARSRAELDFDGDPVIVVDVDYDLSKEPIDAASTFGLTTALRDELAKMGEFRFPHIRHHFDERQEIAH